jgi:hypothetical protein
MGDDGNGRRFRAFPYRARRQHAGSSLGEVPEIRRDSVLNLTKMEC